MSLGLDDKFKFGKHKDKVVRDVVEQDPKYIRWLEEEAVTDFDDEVYEALEQRERHRG